MDNNEIKKMLDVILDAIEQKTVKSAYMYGFKTLPVVTGENPLISLTYEFYKTGIKKNKAIDSVKNILDIFYKKYLSKRDLVYQTYDISNPKNVIDYIYLGDSERLEEETNPDVYKIKFFLNSILNNSELTLTEKDYSKQKHSVIQLETNNDNMITIINKTAPIYKPRNWLYIVNTQEDDSLDLKLVTKYLFRLPLYPHVIIINNYCFMIEDKVESIFGFEQFNKAVRDRQLSQIKSHFNINDAGLEIIEQFTNKKKNYNLFANFNNERFNNIISGDNQTLEILRNSVKLNINDNWEISINDKEEAERLILYLCNGIFKGVDDEEELVYAKNPTLLPVSTS